MTRRPAVRSIFFVFVTPSAVEVPFLETKKDATAIGAIKERFVFIRTISIRFTLTRSKLRTLAIQ